MSNFKEGDIVVSLIEQNTGNPNSEMLKPGDIRCVYGENQSIWFKADGKGAYSVKNFRLATEGEILWFSRGTTNISEMDTKVPCPINVMDKDGILLKIGDRVTFSSGGHNASHKWYDRDRSLKHGQEYTIQDIDLDKDGSGVLKLDDNAARSNYCTKVKHEFKRGGWYRTIGTQFTTNKYIKFFIFDDAKKVVYSERITQAGVHNVFSAEHNYQRSSIAHPTESLVLVPDEEVAEYINKIINSFPIY